MNPYMIRIDHAHCQNQHVTLVDWMLGNRCNYACSYCPASLHDGTIPWLSYEKIRSFAERLILHYDTMGQQLFVQFTGGEPTLYRDLAELLVFLKEKGVRVGLISNGSRTLRFWARIRDSLDAIVLTHHIEYVDFVHFMAVAEFISAQVKTHINVTMPPHRFEAALENAYRLAAMLPTVSITLKPLLVGFGSELYPYTETQLATLASPSISSSNQVEGARGAMQVTYSDGATEVWPASKFIAERQNRWQGWLCAAGVELLTVRPDGAIYRGACKQGGRIGYIDEPNLTLPSAPVVCEKQWCHCLSDIMVSRTIPVA